MNQRQLEKINEVKATNKMYVGVFESAYRGNSKANAIKAMCLDCVGYIRSEVTNCTSLGCPLWTQRPFQKVEKTGTNG